MRRRYVPLAVFALIALVGADVQAVSDPITEFNRRFDGGIRSKAEQFYGTARKDFERAMDTLFRDHVRPLVEQLSILADEKTHGVDQVLEARLGQLEDIINGTIELAATRMTQGTDHVAESLDSVIRNAAREIELLREHAVADVYKILRNANCMVVGATSRFAVDSESILPRVKLTAWFDVCYSRAGIGIFGTKPGQYEKSYLLKKCQLERELRSLDQEADARRVFEILNELTRRAAFMICAVGDTPGVSDALYQKDHQEYGRRVRIWDVALSE